MSKPYQRSEFADFAVLELAAGTALGTSEWFEMTAQRINQFAHATDDHQWIHVDTDRAREESPWGTTIAHGYLTLSLVAPVLNQVLHVATPTTGINYGCDRVRFINPVRAGSRVRGHVSLAEVVRPDEDSARLHCDVTMEIENEERPAAVARVIVLLSRALPAA